MRMGDVTAGHKDDKGYRRIAVQGSSKDSKLENKIWLHKMAEVTAATMNDEVGKLGHS